MEGALPHQGVARLNTHKARLMDGDVARRELDLFAGTGPRVGTPPVDRDRRVRWRLLIAPPHE